MTQTLSPREFDEQLAALYDEWAAADRKAASAMDTLHYLTGERRAYKGRKPYWKQHDGATLVAIQGLIDTGDERSLSHGCTPSQALARLNQAETAKELARLRIEDMETEYRTAPWSRFFPCRNADGHIHSSLRGCPTVRWDTDMAWYPQLSGKTEAEAVAELGPTLCSVCFPSAPVEWTRSKSEIAAEGKTYCTGSGEYAILITRHGMRRYADCPGCGQNMQLTPNGYFRKHEAKS